MDGSDPGKPSPASLDGEYFDELYGRSPEGDPWGFATSDYERAKYAATLARLPRPAYAAALEVGCSIGVFTRLLADRVDHLLAVDISPAALARAEARCADRPRVEFRRVNLLESVPAGRFDLIVVGEVAYYWAPTDFARIFAALRARLAPGGQMLLVHWRAAVPDYPQTGDEVHDQARILAEASGLAHRGGWVEPEYRTDLWEDPGHDGGLA